MGLHEEERIRQQVREDIADSLFGGDFNAADDLLSRIYNAGFDLVPNTLKPGGPWPFVLQRDEDETGASGTGIVAEGVEFTGGTVALRWLSQWPTSVVFHNKGIEAVEAVHGHNGKTKVIWR